VQIRRVAAVTGLVVLAAGAYAPATAATKKPFSGKYDVTLLPDPSPNAFVLAGKDGCFNLNPAAVDKHDLAVPRAGRLELVLDSADPTGTGQTDWDMYVFAKDGELLADASGATSHEETSIKFKAATPVTVVVCNLAGAPSGTVSYKLT
jgi:hypothetical protein